MKKSITLVAVVLLLLTTCGLASDLGVRVERNMTSLPLAFTENKGQWDDMVLFRADAGRATMWFTADGAYYQFTRRIAVEDASLDPVLDPLGHEPDSIEIVVIKAAFVGANLNPIMRGEDLLDYKCNYFIGSDPAGWCTDVPNYSAVVYQDIYPGIDLKYYGNDNEMEYDFIVSPGADPSQIKIQYEGIESLSINSDGELVVKTEWGKVTERHPVVYQIYNGARIPIEGEYQLMDANSFSFLLDDSYDPTLPLLIDPVLEYSTYLGGSGEDHGSHIVLDASGAIYVVGSTGSTDFPTTLGAFQETFQGSLWDVFVTKLSSSVKSMVFSTYLGGSLDDFGLGITLDGSGSLYIVGSTESTDFPTLDPYQTDPGDNDFDAFVTKLNSDGNSLIYSTYLGGNSYDNCGDIAIDASGAAYITGCTGSTDFPTLNPYQMHWEGNYDAYITKLSSSGSSLIYSTYLGKVGHEFCYSIAVDALGAAYVAGITGSPDFPTQNPYQTNQGDWDAFVTKLTSDGSDLAYSTYLGGFYDDYARAIAVDASGSAYVTGRTGSEDFPTKNPYQTDQGDYYDAFVTKLTTDGSDLVYSTYLGGDQSDDAYAIVADAVGAAYVTGYTFSTNFPTVNECQADPGLLSERDVFVTKLTSDGSSLVFSTYVAGSASETGRDIALDGSGVVYVTGETYSSDFPVQDPYQETFQGVRDAFITKLSEEQTHACEETVIGLPDEFHLNQNYPNPFNPATTIQFSLSRRTHVMLRIYNLLGQVVRTLLDKNLSAGTHIVPWDGCDEAGRPLATGIYLYQLKTGQATETKKMLLLR